MLKKYDKPIAIFFGLLTLLFLLAMSQSDSFFNWAFDRHHNTLSWYIRPLFIIPFCYSAYKRSWAGIALSVFGIATSMLWFPAPADPSDSVKEFLQFEKDWLEMPHNFQKILLELTVPVSSFLLGFAFWKRSLWMGVTVIVLMATCKIIWSVYNAGESGMSIIIPAMLGLGICLVLVVLGFRRLNKNKG